jgi:anaerobic magnesium-protoporphyrin IX monomethyl ester cyclase
LDDIEATVEHVKRSDPDVFFTTVSYPIKGTPYFEEVSSRIVSLKAWAEGSDRDYRIRGRHSRRFYQHADQLLRSEVELHRLRKGTNGASGGVSRPAARTSVSPDGQDSSEVAGLERIIVESREGLRATFAEVEA